MPRSIVNTRLEEDHPVAQQQTHQSESRERVINAAYTLFVQRGYADVSMQQIADSTSITKATLYHHFRDKQDLYLATMRMAFTRNHATMTERLQQYPDLHARIREILAFLVEGKRTDMQRLMSDFRQHVDEDSQQRFWSEFPKPWHLLEPMVREAIERGEIPDGDVTFVARFIYSSSAGYAHMLAMSTNGEPFGDATLDRFADTVLYGISRS